MSGLQNPRGIAWATLCSGLHSNPFLFLVSVYLGQQLSQIWYMCPLESKQPFEVLFLSLINKDQKGDSLLFIVCEIL